MLEVNTPVGDGHPGPGETEVGLVVVAVVVVVMEIDSNTVYSHTSSCCNDNNGIGSFRPSLTSGRLGFGAVRRIAGECWCVSVVCVCVCVCV